METNNAKRRKFKLNTFQTIILGFAGVILLGSFLLSLPFATNSGDPVPYIDALFTSTTSVCVTGLITRDTGTYWSLFGQIIILILIQIGGMGVMTVTIMLGLISRRRFSIMQKYTMQDAISAPVFGDTIKLTKYIICVTACTEAAGALCLLPVFKQHYGWLKAIWYSVFHAISAFCNAGIDLNGVEQPYCSLTHYYNNPVVNFVIMFLIVFGGIGFITWDDMRRNGFKFKKYRLQSKIALLMTAILIILPALYFYIYEFHRVRWDWMSEGGRIMASLFQAVTPRTAGFNTIDLNMMSDVSKMIIIVLMLIGASPGSTAGGMKTTTVAVLISTAFSVFKKREDPEAFHRRLSADAVRSASAVLSMYVALFMLGSIIICQLEDVPIMPAMFETASAIGTVGLSLGITPGLCTVSKVVLISLMYFGRVGGLTLIFAAASGIQKKRSKYPLEKVAVG